MRVDRLLLAVGMMAGLAAATRVQAQGTPGVEIGTQMAGLVRVSREGFSSHTTFALPGGGVEFLPTLYAAIFPSPRFGIEPAVAYENQSENGNTEWFGAALLRFSGYFSGVEQPSPFLFAEAGVLGNSGSDSHAGFGAGGGYRWPVANRRVALRLEGRVRRWRTNPDQTEVGAVLAVGIVLGHAR